MYTKVPCRGPLPLIKQNGAALSDRRKLKVYPQAFSLTGIIELPDFDRPPRSGYRFADTLGVVQGYRWCCLRELIEFCIQCASMVGRADYATFWRQWLSSLVRRNQAGVPGD